MPDIYDQELDGIETAATEDKKEAETATKEAAPEIKTPERVVDKDVSKTKAPEEEGVRLSKDEYESFKRSQHKEELNALEASFKKQYPDFDMEKVKEKIIEIDAKSPGFAENYFNPLGIENVYLTHFKGKTIEADDEFDIGRGIGGGSSKAEMIGKINKGEASLSDKQAFYAKYF
ncbi:hypothetical protein [Campylobacter sp. RM16188]|uniref:hypothetical protein n=1 Tax=Campylobacter sp. RM16188 TaxID=1705725 RepID=UPI00155797D2|nr:hypothetical protein [Campylobacter sp. RM16188]